MRSPKPSRRSTASEGLDSESTGSSTASQSVVLLRQSTRLSHQPWTDAVNAINGYVMIVPPRRLIAYDRRSGLRRQWSGDGILGANLLAPTDL